MLNELKVLNGVMTPKFDKYNNVYSVSIEENVTELMLEYKANPEYYVRVVGNNNLVPGDNVVFIEVTTDEYVNSYQLLVYKEYTESVFNVKELVSELEVKKEVPEYVAPLIVGIGFLIIAVFYLILFKKKKPKRASK